MLHFVDAVPITHQAHLPAVDADDTVHHIACAVHPRQHYVAHLQRLLRTHQFHALLAADDKRMHATAFHGQHHAPSFLQHRYRLLNQRVTFQCPHNIFHFVSEFSLLPSFKGGVARRAGWFIYWLSLPFRYHPLPLLPGGGESPLSLWRGVGGEAFVAHPRCFLIRQTV